MKYLIIVYFGSPSAIGAAWTGGIDEQSVIYRAHAQWLWFARMVARGYLGNTNRCGYVITDATGIVDELVPTFQVV